MQVETLVQEEEGIFQPIEEDQIQLILIARKEHLRTHAKLLNNSYSL